MKSNKNIKYRQALSWQLQQVRLKLQLSCIEVIDLLTTNTRIYIDKYICTMQIQSTNGHTVLLSHLRCYSLTAHPLRFHSAQEITLPLTFTHMHIYIYTFICIYLLIIIAYINRTSLLDKPTLCLSVWF